MTAVGGRMFVMYGQTEAAPRMATLPSELVPDKPGSVGPALPGGQFTSHGGGEIVYHGPNVMMGYASSEPTTWPGATTVTASWPPATSVTSTPRTA